ncbi:MAG: autotransporter-associated beta strand repeat-containing protein [Myxococcaceae bacterium]
MAAHAADITWRGGCVSNITWANAACWSPSQVPAASDRAFLDDVDVPVANHNFDGPEINANGSCTILGNGLRASSLVVSGDSTLTIDAFVGQTRVNDAGHLVKRGPGALDVSDTLSHGGQTVIEAGTLRLLASNLIPNGSRVDVWAGAIFDIGGETERVAGLSGQGSVMSMAGATLDLAPLSPRDFLGGISGPVDVIVRTGTQRLSGSNSFTGSTQVISGVLETSGGNALPDAFPVTVSSGAQLSIVGSETVGPLGGSGTLFIADGQSLTVNVPSASGAFSGAMVGSATTSIRKSGAGSLYLASTLSFGGSVYVDAGELSVTPNVVGSPAQGTVVGNGARLSLNPGSYAAEPITLQTGATLELPPGNHTWTGPATLQGNAALVCPAGNVRVDWTSNLDLGGHEVRFDVRAGELALPNALTSGSIRKTGAGALLLSGASTYAGTTHLEGGLLRAIPNGSVSSLSPNSLFVLSGGTELRIEQISSLGGLTTSGGWVTPPLVSAPSAASELTLHVASGALSFGGRIQGPLRLIKTGVGQQTLAGDGDWNGTARVAAGRLRLEGTRQLTRLEAASGATLEVQGAMEDAVVSVEPGGRLEAQGLSQNNPLLGVRRVELSDTSVWAVALRNNGNDGVAALATHGVTFQLDGNIEVTTEAGAPERDYVIGTFTPGTAIDNGATVMNLMDPGGAGYNLEDASLHLRNPEGQLVLRLSRPPRVNAGADRESRSADISLLGTAVDDFGGVAGTSWTQVAGPAGVVCATPFALTTTCALSGSGIYTFRLTATDAHGRVGHDDVRVAYGLPLDGLPISVPGPPQISGLTLTLRGRVPPGTSQVRCGSISATPDSSGNYDIELPVAAGGSSCDLSAETPEGVRVRRIQWGTP